MLSTPQQNIDPQDFDFGRLFSNPKNEYILKGEYNILLLGGTGHGKTSFLNLLLLCNKALRGITELNAIVDQNDESLENDSGDPTQSKTTGCKIYEAVIGYKTIRIIDTPGFGDTRGLQQDKVNNEAIKQTIESLGGVNSIVVVQNGREPRMTTEMQYAYSSLTNILPKKISENIVLVLTNCETIFECNFTPKSINQFFGFANDYKPSYICIDNPFVYANRFRKLIETGDFPEDKAIRDLNKKYQTAADSIIDFTHYLAQFEVVQTYEFSKLYRQREELEKNIAIAQASIDTQQSILSKLNENFKILQQAEKEGVSFKQSLNKLNKYYTHHYTQPTSYHNTVCNECKKNCHRECTLSFTKQGNNFVSCAINYNDDSGKWDRGNCNHCGCDVVTHTHGHFLHRSEQRINEQWQQSKDNLDQKQSDAQYYKNKLLEIDQEYQSSQLQIVQHQLTIQEAMENLKSVQLGVGIVRLYLIRLDLINKRLQDNNASPAERDMLTQEKQHIQTQLPLLMPQWEAQNKKQKEENGVFSQIKNFFKGKGK